MGKLFVIIMHNDHRISLSNINLMKKVFPRFGYIATQNAVCKHYNSIYSKEPKFSSKAPVKPLVKNKKLNNRSKSQVNLTKSILEDMDEHAPVMSPLAINYVPITQKQVSKHATTERANSHSNVNNRQLEYPKRIALEKKIPKFSESAKFKSRSVMIESIRVLHNIGCRYFSSNPKAKLKVGM